VLDRLEPGYAELFERVASACARDDRVRAMWLSGSLARGTADRASDLDVLVAVADQSFDDFASRWEEWLAAITPTVIARPLPFVAGFFSVTPQRLRLDVVIERVSQLLDTRFRERTVVIDRDRLGATIPPRSEPAPPDPARIAHLVEEFFRDYGMFNTVVERRDWLLGIEAIHMIRSLLYQLFVESNAPQPPTGVKQWSARLTAEQRAALEALPTGTATADGVVAAHEAVACAFVRHARAVCTDLAVPWPSDLEEATVAYLAAHGLPALECAR
jgi:predicted nucleotidyltransferase